MDICTYCEENSLIITDENITCLQCSRVQPHYLDSDPFSEKEDSLISSSLLDEYCERETLDLVDKNTILRRLDKLRKAISVFSKSDLNFSLIYMSKLERGTSLSPQAFSASVGNLITAKQLDICLSYLKQKLDLKEVGSCLEWQKLLKPYCEKFTFLRQDNLKYMKSLCEKIRLSSNLSVYSIAALVFVLVFSTKKNVLVKKIIHSVSSFSKISIATLRKNCRKFSHFLEDVNL